MKSTESKFLIKQCFRRCRKAGASVLKSAIWGHTSNRYMWLCFDEEDYIPKDVPKGHLVVYVGEDCKRYVIKVALLRHPLFKALLDHAEEVFQFSTNSKLCIPCNECIFLSVLCCIGAELDQGLHCH
ncbi:unnamed protein product [Prunus brigantina]